MMGAAFGDFSFLVKKMIKSNYEFSSISTQPAKKKSRCFLAFLLLDFLKHHQPFLGPHHLSSGFFIPSFFECITGFPSSFVMVISWSSGSFCHEGFGQQHCIDSELMIVPASEMVASTAKESTVTSGLFSEGPLQNEHIFIHIYILSIESKIAIQSVKSQNYQLLLSFTV